jgi:penicillin-binding protein 1A
MASSSSSRAKGIIITSLKWALAAGFLGLVGLLVAVGVAMTQLPDYEQLSKRSDLGQMVRVRAADGTLLVSLGPSFGRWLTYDEIPATMRAAMIAVEDKRFRSHIGVDPIGVARSFKVRLESGRWKQGGSTITQQLARNIFLTNSRTFGRKVKEGVLALALERKFSKDQILELYLNRVYFGGGAYGIDAASRTFFGHGAERLKLGEAAIIAGLVKAPSNYSPTADIEAARGRAGVVLNSMVENGFLPAASAVDIDPADIKVQPAPKQNSVRYFTDWALPQLDMLIDETSEPIDVWTTLDPAMQSAANKAINGYTPPGAQGALVAIDRDGAVRAMVGGRDYVESIYNLGRPRPSASRDPLSSFSSTWPRSNQA